MLNLTSEFILLVDDTPTNLSVLKQTLKSAGLKVRFAADGYSAIEQALAEPPALILLDVQMPGIDGFETCAKLKSHPLTQDIPVIFMTALADTESKLKGLSLGAVDYITKPFEQEEVLARVKIHLQLRNLTQTLVEKNAQLEEFNQNLEQKVQERTVALQQAQLKLVQQEKLSTLGLLVAGVAHELNNPISCISGNIPSALDYVSDLAKIIRFYQQNSFSAPELTGLLEEVDIDFTLEDLTKILNTVELSSERIQNISVSLRNFSRLDTNAKVKANIHDGLDSTLIILGHRLKSVGNRPAIEITKQYGDLPEIQCYPGSLNQVFMNLLANAIDALEESFAANNLALPQIKITTDAIDNEVMIKITDNGVGMSEQVKQRLFDPLFTTKPVGKGTGLGLSIAQQIVEDKHKGRLSVASVLGQGCEFTVSLPN